MASRFVKLPTWWTRLDVNYFPGGVNSGQSIAGLKCLLALSLTLNFHTNEIEISLTILEEITGLSRPMVAKGIAYLEEAGLVEVNRDGYVNLYTVNEHEDDSGWGKLPYLVLKKELSSFLNRGGIPLLALKIYVLLASRRPNNAASFCMSYETILAHTKGQRSHVRKALDLLIVHGMLKVEKPDDMKSSNIYTILGL